MYVRRICIHVMKLKQRTLIITSESYAFNLWIQIFMFIIEQSKYYVYLLCALLGCYILGDNLSFFYHHAFLRRGSKNPAGRARDLGGDEVRGLYHNFQPLAAFRRVPPLWWQTLAQNARKGASFRPESIEPSLWPMRDLGTGGSHLTSFTISRRLGETIFGWDVLVYSYGELPVLHLEESPNEHCPLEDEGGEEEVDPHRRISIALQEGHQKSESHENHHVNVLEHWNSSFALQNLTPLELVANVSSRNVCWNTVHSGLLKCFRFWKAGQGCKHFRLTILPAYSHYKYIEVIDIPACQKKF